MNDDTSEEKRRFTRVDFDATTTVSDNSGGHWLTQLIDISLNGVLLERPDAWQGNIDDAYKIEVQLNNDITIAMNVTVAHIEKTQVGFRCEHIDFDSISHLRRLMELNLGDATSINRELSMLGEN